MCNYDSIIIHIGFHKAGSTYLQNLFNQLPVDLLLLSSEKSHSLDYIQNEKTFLPKKFKKCLKRELGDFKHPTFLLSHEELSGHPHGYEHPNPFQIADKLKESFPHAKILIIIRNQCDYLLSLYAFRVAIKGIEYKSIDRFLLAESQKGLLKKLEYHQLIQYYFNLFPKDQILVLPLELLTKDKDDFFQSLFSFIGCEIKNIPSEKRINVSTKLAIVISFWRLPNLIFSGLLKMISLLHIPDKTIRGIRFVYYNSFKRKITPVLNRIFQHTKKIKFSEEFSLMVFPKYAKSNCQLNGLTDLDLKGLGYPYE